LGLKELGNRILFLLLLSFLQLYFVCDYANGGNPNEQSHIYLAKAIVEDHTLSIDGPFMRFGSTLDRAVHDNRTYTDKAPGGSFLAVPVELGLRLIEGREPPIHHSQIAYRIVLLIVPTFFLTFFLWVFLERTFPGSEFPIRLVIAAYALGSLAFPYVLYFFSHQIVAVALMGSFLLVYESDAPWRTALGGALAGIAVLSELQALPTAAMLALLIALRHRRLAPLVWFAPGILAALAVMALYNAACFGGPLEIGYHHLDQPAIQEYHDRGIAGVTYPRWRAFRGARFGVRCGLFVFSPLWLCALPGLVALWMKKMRALAAVLALVLLTWILFIASAKAWHAGWAVGPRLLAPLVPFLTIPTAAFIVRFWNVARGWPRPLFAGMAAWGITVHAAAAAVHPAFHCDLRNPIFEHGFSVLGAGVSRPSLLTALGMAPEASLFVFSALILLIILYLAGCGHSPVRTPARYIACTAAAAVIAICIGLGVRYGGGRTLGTAVPELIAWEKERFTHYFGRNPEPLP